MKRHLYQIVLGAALVGVGLAPAHGQNATSGLCYATPGGLPSPSNLLSIDLETGAVDTVVTLSDTTGYPALAINSTGEIFVTRSDNDGLYRVDASTGTVSLIGNLGGAVVRGMAFDTSNVLFGVTIDWELVRIDAVTAALTVVGDHFPVTYSGIDFDPSSPGTLYGISDNFDGGSGIPDELVTFDTTSGASTLIGQTGLGRNTTDIAFDSVGTLFVAHGGGDPSSDPATYIIQLDKATGLASDTVATIPGRGTVSGMDCFFASDAPPPPPPPPTGKLEVCHVAGKSGRDAYDFGRCNIPARSSRPRRHGRRV